MQFTGIDDLTLQAQAVNDPAPYVDPKILQAITRIGGVDSHGDPVLRFAWGQSETRIIDGQVRLKYVWFTQSQGETGFYDIGVPRWFVEEKFYLTEADRSNWKAWQGPFPERGMYRAILMLEDEHGQYAAPNYDLLVRLQAVKQKIDSTDGLGRLDDPLSYVNREKEISGMIYAYKSKRALVNAKRRQFISDYFKENKRRHTTNRPNAGRVKR